MKKQAVFLLLAAAVVGLLAARKSQAATSGSTATGEGLGERVTGIGDAAFPGIIGDPYLRAEADAISQGAPDSSVLGGKLNWAFLTAVAGSNALNRRGKGGITDDRLYPAAPSAQAAAGGAAGGGAGGGGGVYGGRFGGGAVIP